MKRVLVGLFLVAAGLAALWIARADEPAARSESPAPPIETPHAPVSRREAIPSAPSEPEPAPAAAPVSEATRRSDAQWAEVNDRAIADLEAGRLEAAVEGFERCHAAVPEEPVFRRNLAEALVRLARAEHERGEKSSLARAIELVERAVTLAPERADLAPLAARWRELAGAEDGFWADASEHFELAYDGSREGFLWSSFEILERLEKSYQSFGELFARFPVEQGRPRIRVVLYTREVFADVSGVGHWAGGVFDGTVRVPVESVRSEKAALERVLRHELAHAFVHEVGGDGVPAWLHEGLAQWLESERAVERDARVARARERLAGRELFPLERLREGLSQWTDEKEVARAYDQALALVAWIAREYGERVPLEMASGCARSVPVEETFSRLAGVPLDVALGDLGRSL